MTNRIDIFVRGCGDHLHKKSWSGSSWSDWQDLGGCLRSEPAVTSWGSTRLDVFVRGCYDALNWMYSDNSGSSWSSWQDLGGCVNAAPGAATGAGIIWPLSSAAAAMVCIETTGSVALGPASTRRAPP